MSLKLITGPAVEPLSLSEAKAFLRLETNADDALVTACIAAARRFVEDYLGRALINQTWELVLDGFPGYDAAFGLGLGSVSDVTSITYLDDAGALQTLDADDYQVDTDSLDGRVAPEPSASWPTTENGRLNAVRIRFVAGYGASGAALPPTVLVALRQLVAALYEQRTPEVTGTIVAKVGTSFEVLLAPHRVVRF